MPSRRHRRRCASQCGQSPGSPRSCTGGRPSTWVPGQWLKQHRSERNLPRSSSRSRKQSPMGTPSRRRRRRWWSRGGRGCGRCTREPRRQSGCLLRSVWWWWQAQSRGSSSYRHKKSQMGKPSHQHRRRCSHQCGRMRAPRSGQQHGSLLGEQRVWSSRCRCSTKSPLGRRDRQCRRKCSRQ